MTSSIVVAPEKKLDGDEEQTLTYSATATKSKMATPRFKKSFW